MQVIIRMRIASQRHPEPEIKVFASRKRAVATIPAGPNELKRDYDSHVTVTEGGCLVDTYHLIRRKVED